MCFVDVLAERPRLVKGEQWYDAELSVTLRIGGGDWLSKG